MKIVIAGAGEVGAHLARLLSRENQDIILVDQNEERLTQLDSTCNILTQTGSPTSMTVLKTAKVPQCDLFVAVTPYETTNILSSSMAKSLGAKKAMARIDNYEFMEPTNLEFFGKIGIDSMVYPEYLAAIEILKALECNWMRNWVELHDGKLIVAGVKIRAGAPLAGKHLRELSEMEHFFHVAAIKRNHETIIPRGDDRVLPNDIIYITTTPNHIEELRTICGKKKVDIHNVLIMGGSRIAVRLINMAPERYRFKIIDINRDRCEELTQKCPGCKIIHGDARDTDTLQEEGIESADAFISLTGSSETNILTSLTAKEYGVRKTVAEVEDIQFISEGENLNIGTIINKKLLASGKIFQMLLDADSESSKFMALADADVAEVEVKPNSKITKAAVKDMKLSHDLTLAGLVRNGNVMLVNGNTRFEAGDHVVVFCLSGAIHKVEKLFS